MRGVVLSVLIVVASWDTVQAAFVPYNPAKVFKSAGTAPHASSQPPSAEDSQALPFVLYSSSRKPVPQISSALEVDRNPFARRTVRGADPPATLAYVEAAVVEFARAYEWSQFAPSATTVQRAPVTGDEKPDKPEIYYGYELKVDCRVRLAHVSGMFLPTERKCEYDAVTLYPTIPIP